MNLPKISIITPSFNQAQFLEETISSVLSQEYPNLEYIIIDGGSTDGSVEIIKKYERQLAYWISEPDAGQSDAINKGLKRATGEIINWLNSDDYYFPGALIKIAEAFADRKTEVVCARARLLNQDLKKESFSNGTDVYPGNLAKTIGWARIDQPETFFRADLFKALGNLDAELHFLMDRDLWLRYLLRYGQDHVKKIDQVIVNFRIHPQSKTSLQRNYFQVEHDSWFYAFAKKYFTDQFSETFKNHFKVNEFFTIKNMPEISLPLAEKIINYFLLFRAYEFYAQRKTEDFFSLVSTINPGLLEETDRLHLNKLVRRGKYIPGFVFKLLSQFKIR